MRLLRSAPALRVTRPLAAAQRAAMGRQDALPGRLPRPRVRVGPRRTAPPRKPSRPRTSGLSSPACPRQPGNAPRGLWRATAARPSDRGRGAGREFSPPFRCALIRRSTSCDMPMYCNPPCRLQHNRYTDQEPLSALERAANLAKPTISTPHQYHINTTALRKISR